ncbi:hypothetical protein MATL_G00015790 [Megalops atlanticus]|uniref:Uncharacterized protein n=1 Tax=Megalops atlanticus TaxID=7932 RepID=A0A9D3QKA0_MEGAT|nr:hypothetical protein MATL_G00015790 [Megalops atlanticus]
MLCFFLYRTMRVTHSTNHALAFWIHTNRKCACLGGSCFSAERASRQISFDVTSLGWFFRSLSLCCVNNDKCTPGHIGYLTQCGRGILCRNSLHHARSLATSLGSILQWTTFQITAYIAFYWRGWHLNTEVLFSNPIVFSHVVCSTQFSTAFVAKM